MRWLSFANKCSKPMLQNPKTQTHQKKKQPFTYILIHLFRQKLHYDSEVFANYLEKGWV